MLPLAAEHREAAGVTAGQEVEVDLEVDDAPREVEVPEDLAVGTGVRIRPPSAAFEKLSVQQQATDRAARSREPRRAETRARRIDKAWPSSRG